MPSNNVLDQRLVERRRSTAALIDAEGQKIALFRPGGGDTVDDGAGSRRKVSETPTELAPKLRCVFGLTQTGRGANQDPGRWFTTSLGQRQRVVYVLIGLYNDDIRKGDWWFDANGNKCEVVYVYDDRSYQTKAECVVFSSGEGS